MEEGPKPLTNVTGCLSKINSSSDFTQDINPKGYTDGEGQLGGAHCGGLVTLIPIDSIGGTAREEFGDLPCWRR